MKTSPAILLLVSLTVAVTACKGRGDKPPRYASSVSVVTFANIGPRQVNPEFEIFPSAEAVKRPHKVIALVCRNAKPQDQGLMLNAIAWRAKQLGADAMILLPPEATGSSYTDFGRVGMGGSQEPIYRAHAIIYTDTNSAQ